MGKLGSTILFFDSLGSTNDTARDLAESGAEEGLAVVAREQTAGKGRQGRSWASPSGQGLYLSIVLRPDIKAVEAPVIGLGAALAVAETLEGDFGLEVDIKWPNDVLVRGRKICGILVESASEAERLLYAVLGIGINVAQQSFEAELAPSATSIRIESQRAVGTDEVLRPLLERVDARYRQTLAAPATMLREWEARSTFASGCDVQVTSHNGSLRGVTRGVTSAGGLILQLADGSRREIFSGEVSLRKS